MEGKAYIGGALLSLVGYVLYSNLIDLNEALDRNPANDTTLISPDQLSDYYDQLFQKRAVRIRFIGYTGETVFNTVIQRLDRLSRDPGHTRSVSVHILVPDYTRPMAPPCRADAATGAEGDDPEFRLHQANLSADLAHRLHQTADNLQRRTNIVADVQVKQYIGSPVLKLYLLDDKDAFLGLYDELPAKSFSPRGSAHETHDVYDPQGFDTALLHWNSNDGDQHAAAVSRCNLFFDNRWKISATLSVRQR